MVKDEVLMVKDAVYKLQLLLLEGIRHENQLTAAGLLISQSDYQDVVTERKIANMCGFPICSNSLPSEQARKGRYRISLKDHTVYDLQETHTYCSSGCLINSRAFAGILEKERPSTLNSSKINEVMKLFEGLNLESGRNMGKNGDLGISKLKIQEKISKDAGEVPLEEWIGPSNAIDGYVPRRDRHLKPQKSNSHKFGQVESKLRDAQTVLGMVKDLNLSPPVITQDEYSVSKPAPSKKSTKIIKKGNSEGAIDHGNLMHIPAAPLAENKETRSINLKKDNNVSSTENNLVSSQQDPNINVTKAGGAQVLERESAAGAIGRKSSLKNSVSKKATCSVTWADENADVGGQDLCEYADNEVVEDSYRYASAEACAIALGQAAEHVASGIANVSSAFSEAGIIILPPHEVDEAESQESDDLSDDLMDTESPLHWPPILGFSNSDDSWYDSPPDGFNLNLSPFSTMYMALFSWLSSSSLAYIYGKDESFHEDYLSVNGREYPRKIIVPDGRSSEIKQTLAGCLSRTLPDLVAELRLPISNLEQRLGHLIETMSFIDPLPAFNTKQWQVIILLFLDALSVSRIPALTQYMMDKRIFLPKVLEGSHIGAEEFEIMKDLIIPLGRVPQFSTQSGG